MAKVTLARKKELQEADEFITLSSRALQYVLANKKEVAGAVGAVMLVLAVITGWSYYSEYKENRAFTTLSRQLDDYKNLVKKSGEASAREAALKEGDRFLAKYAGTGAGLIAGAKFAAMHYRQGEYDQAISICRRALKAVDSGSSYYNGLLLFMGLSHEAKGDDDNALNYYEKVVAGPSPLKKDEALFHMGLIYNAKGNRGKRDEVFEKLTSEHPTSLFHDVVREKSAG